MIGVDRGSRVKGNVSRIYFIEVNLVKSRFFEFFRGDKMMVECDIGMIWEIKGNVFYIKVILGDSIFF